MIHVAMGVLSDHYLSEDAVHNAFIKVANCIARIDFSSDVRPLLYTIAKNEALTLNRKRAKEQALAEQSIQQALYGHQLSVERDYENKAEVESIAQYVAQLPDDYSAIFTLRFRYQFKTKEIAYMLDLSDDVVRKRLQRMKQAIEKLIEEEGW